MTRMEEALGPDNMHMIKALPTYFVASNQIFFVLSKVGGCTLKDDLSCEK